MYGPHVIGSPASLNQLFDATGLGVVKYLNPSGKVRLAPITIGRDHPLSEEKDLSDPFALARRHADKSAALADATGITSWEGLNEWAVTDAQNKNPDLVKRFVDYECERTRRLNERGLFAVVCNFGVGHPREVNGRIDWDLFGPLFSSLKPGNYLGAHEYMEKGGPDSVWPFKCGRILRCPYNVPILITECGVDLGGGQQDGWRGQGVSLSTYLGYLVRYREQMMADRRIKGLLIFTYGIIQQWGSFDIQPDWRWFVDLMKPIAQPLRADEIRVQTSSGVKVLPLEEYLRGVVPAEMGALQLAIPDDPDKQDGPTHPEDVALETLKAQAVLSRSYAMWRMKHPRSSTVDIYGDARDQAYNPAKIHPRGDAAVKSTASLFLSIKGSSEPLGAQYVSRCGREDCKYCHKASVGYQGHEWPARACQFGMHYLGAHGATFRQIVDYFRPENVEFSDHQPEGERKMGKITLYKDPNTDSFAMGSNGKVTAARVDIIKAEKAAPLTTGQRVFRAVNVSFDDEEQAGGDTRILVAVVDKAGMPVKAKVFHAWPQQRIRDGAPTAGLWPESDNNCADWCAPGDPAEFAMGGGNYDPSKHGPLGPYVITVEKDGYNVPVVADWLIGFGLPGNRHVRYRVTYQECEAYVNDVYMDEAPITPVTPPVVPPVTPTVEPIDTVLDEPLQQIFSRLLTSSKGQLALIGAVAAIILLATKTIEPQQFLDFMKVVLGAYMGTTALEDAARKMTVPGSK